MTVVPMPRRVRSTFLLEDTQPGCFDGANQASRQLVARQQHTRRRGRRSCARRECPRRAGWRSRPPQLRHSIAHREDGTVHDERGAGAVHGTAVSSREVRDQEVVLVVLADRPASSPREQLHADLAGSGARPRAITGRCPCRRMHVNTIEVEAKSCCPTRNWSHSSRRISSRSLTNVPLDDPRSTRLNRRG